MSVVVDCDCGATQTPTYRHIIDAAVDATMPLENTRRCHMLVVSQSDSAIHVISWIAQERASFAHMPNPNTILNLLAMAAQRRASPVVVDDSERDTVDDDAIVSTAPEVEQHVQKKR